eukprot:TRINITY_DN6170_c0_g1_i1.p1 TRINITY_DN6170_c0_g1~~TRINITY_DN6170_c0_g1_i1.p1  ORF type:complete len:759 (-),score=177.88 TRINITY_DN6170_c0_g1_i1:124-2400(-)
MSQATAKKPQQNKATAAHKYVLMYNPNQPPISALLLVDMWPRLFSAAKLVPKPGNSRYTITSTEVKGEVEGVNALRLLARFADQSGETCLYGKNLIASGQIDFYLDLANHYVKNFCSGGLKTFCEKLNVHLRSRTYLVPHDLSIADFAMWESLRANPNFEAIQKQADQFPALFRWCSFFSDLPELKKITATLTAKASKFDELAKASQAGSFKVHLEGAEMGKMVTRFPPEPSGYLHIGHAKAALLNDTFARMYNGKLILRFDDTNPGKEKQEFVDNIYKDLKTLGVKWDVLTHTSDNFPLYMQFAEKLIKQGDAYVDNTPVKIMREERKKGTESKCRSQSVEENLRLWKEMQAASEEGKKCVLRAKISMDAQNKTLCDPTLYRVNLTNHWRTGRKYNIYPTYDFACPIVDSIEGVTHALRTTEYHDRNAQYDWVVKTCGLRKVHVWDYSRLSFRYTMMSKRKLQWFVDQKVVEGWFDPRFPTIQGMIRRGLQVEALRKFILDQGASKALTTQDWDKLWSLNAKVVDPIAARYSAVKAENKVPLYLSNFESKTPVSVTVPLFPNQADKGSKTIYKNSVAFLDQSDAKSFAQGEEITLITWGNCFIRKIEKKGDVITRLDGELHLEGNFKTTDKKVHWIAAEEKDFIPIVLTEFDHLITKPVLEKKDDFKLFLNTKTKFETPALGEPALKNLKQGEVVQLQRIGFFYCDRAYESKEKPMVLHGMPTGRAKPMSNASTAVAKREEPKVPTKGKQPKKTQDS